MQVTAYKTDKITVGSHQLFAVLDASLPPLSEGSVVAVASKIIALCEGRAVPIATTDKDQLIAQESQRYLPRSTSKYDVSFTITRNMLVPTAGIDESNADGYYVLWPANLQSSANAIREHLMQKHGIRKLGVVITDSVIRPLEWGTTGGAIAYSGFMPLKSYIGSDDLFGRTLEYHTASIANGLAASATLVMGEGNEQTPLAVVRDIPFVSFQDHAPTPTELNALKIEPADDLYWPLLHNAPWQMGEAT